MSAVPELAENRVVKAWVGQFKPEQVLPVQTPANSISGLPVRKPFSELEDRYERELRG